MAANHAGSTGALGSGVLLNDDERRVTTDDLKAASTRHIAVSRGRVASARAHVRATEARLERARNRLQAAELRLTLMSVLRQPGARDAGRAPPAGRRPPGS